MAVITKQPDTDRTQALYLIELSPADLDEIKAGGAAQVEAVLPLTPARVFIGIKARRERR